MKRGCIYFAITALLTAIFSPVDAVPPGYNIRDLGTYANLHLTKINASGEVIVKTTNAQGYAEAYFWQPGENVTYIGNFAAQSINDYGQVTGSYTKALIWERGKSTIYLSEGASQGFAINNRMEVAGRYFPSGRYQPCLWDTGHNLVDLGSLGVNTGNASASGINNNGLVVGWSYDANSHRRAFLWQPGNGMTNLGTLGGLTSEAHDVNDSGQVVGVSNLAGDASNNPFIWDSTNGMVCLVSGAGQCTAINNNGHVVGMKYGMGGFIWEPGTGVTYLNGLVDPASQWDVHYVDDINDNGWIVGRGYDANGQMHAILLTPVPEPSSLLALLCGLGGIGGFLYRRRK